MKKLAFKVAVFALLLGVGQALHWLGGSSLFPIRDLQGCFLVAYAAVVTWVCTRFA